MMQISGGVSPPSGRWRISCMPHSSYRIFALSLCKISDPNRFRGQVFDTRNLAATSENGPRGTGTVRRLFCGFPSTPIDVIQSSESSIVGGSNFLDITDVDAPESTRKSIGTSATVRVTFPQTAVCPTAAMAVPGCPPFQDRGGGPSGSWSGLGFLHSLLTCPTIPQFQQVGPPWLRPPPFCLLSCRGPLFGWYPCWGVGCG
ncbi:hypothetical protein FKM82_008215 [Ascaphus truei]